MHRFLADILSYHLKMVLEWVCIEYGRLQRFLRRWGEGGDVDGSNGHSKEEKKEDKDKTNNAGGSGWFVSGNSASPRNSSWDSASGSEDDGTDGAARMKIEIVSDLRFSEARGVRSFKEEVLAGQL